MYAIKTTEDLKDLARQHNNHFFNPSTMRFFNSRASKYVRMLNPDRGLFVTSEKYEDEPRKYTVRIFTINPYQDQYGATQLRIDIDSFGEFQQYDSSREAWRAIDAIAQNHAYIN